MLAQLAYAEIRVPLHEGRTRPGRHHEGEPADVGVARCGGFQAGLGDGVRPAAGRPGDDHAEPISLKIEPGTADATTYPASGECETQR